VFAGGIVVEPAAPLGVVVVVVLVSAGGVPVVAAPVESLEVVDAAEELSPVGDVSFFLAQPAIMTLDAARTAPAANSVERQVVVLMG
jgi:energy-converting hydrogenase Eha subunit C